MKLLTLLLAATLSFGSVASDSMEMCSEYSVLIDLLKTFFHGQTRIFHNLSRTTYLG